MPLSPPPVPLLRVRGLAKRYHRGVSPRATVHEVFRDIQLDASAGECLTIVGPRGVGKSTLLYCLAGLLPPTHGTIHWHLPRDARGRPQGIAFAPERPQYYAFLTVRETLEYYAVLNDTPAEDRSSRVDRVLDRLELRAVAQQAIVQLSSAMLQRVRLAQMLLSVSTVLLLDELVTGLDPHTLDDIGRVCRETIESGALVIVTSSDLRAAERIGTRTLWMVNGTLHPRQTYQSYQSHRLSGTAGMGTMGTLSPESAMPYALLVAEGQLPSGLRMSTRPLDPGNPDNPVNPVDPLGGSHLP